MSKQANKTVIGIFVVIAVALAVAAVIVFGSGKFFSHRTLSVAFFEGSVKGLRAGAPVTFRGVPIGEVKSIQVVYNPKDHSFWIPVILELEPDKIQDWGAYVEQVARSERKDMLIKAGLRAQLQMQSLVTGQLSVDLDFYPGKPAHFVKPEIPELKIPYPEIPTIKTPLQEISETIQQFPLQEMAQDIAQSLKGISQLVGSANLTQGVEGVNETIKEIRSLVANVNSKVEVLGGDLDSTIKDTRALIDNINDRSGSILANIDQTTLDARKLFNNLDKQMQPLTASLKATLDAAEASLVQVRKTLQTIEYAAGENSPVRYQLLDALNEVARAARSVRVFADYLEQNPDALLRGKGAGGGRK
jgi:paraquat-inducible protein B